MSELLTQPDLHTLTGYARASQQAIWLTNQGIPFRRDGNRVIVSRTHMTAWLEGRNIVRSNGFNLAGINEKIKVSASTL